MTTKITTDEWLAELERIEREQPKQEGFTIKEIGAAIGRSAEATRKIVETLIKNGKVEPVKVSRTSLLSGVTRPVPGFRLIKKCKARK